MALVALQSSKPSTSKMPARRPHLSGCLWPYAMGRPAPTLTTGFGCNGRGRFTHPWSTSAYLMRQPRANLSGFLDMRISEKNRLYTLIGNAVPPLMVRCVLSKLFEMCGKISFLKPKKKLGLLIHGLGDHQVVRFFLISETTSNLVCESSNTEVQAHVHFLEGITTFVRWHQRLSKSIG